MSQFHSLALKELTIQQVRFAPPARRKEQLERARKLLTEIEPGRTYPYQYVCYRITDFRSDAYPDLLLGGADLRHDLLLLVDRLDRSLPAVPIEKAEEPMLTLDQVSKQLNVSTKTVTRWRTHGLIGRRVLCNGRRQLGFPQSEVERFVASHHRRVERGGRFSHLSDAEKEDILRRARRLTRVGGTLTEVSRRIARRLGRSTEAVRYTIKNFDRTHPGQALFPDADGPLSPTAKDVIYHLFRKGVTVETIAKQYARSKSSVHRVYNEVRAEQLKAKAPDYIYHPSFDDPTQEAAILGPMPGQEQFDIQRRGMKAPKDVPPELAPMYEMPLLSREQEQHLFRRMNFLKHKLKQLCERIQPDRVRVQDLAAADELANQVAAVKDTLIKCNMRLVGSIAKKHVSPADNYFELLSDGNMSLIRAVEKFDYSRGNKFSTYATWAIMKNFARSIPDEKHHRERFVTGREEVFDGREDVRTDEQEVLFAAEQTKQRVNRLLEQLEPREREIIRMRAGLDGSEPMTLEQIGKQLGITKERVRQLNVRAMKRMRESVSGQNLD